MSDKAPCLWAKSPCLLSASIEGSQADLLLCKEEKSQSLQSSWQAYILIEFDIQNTLKFKYFIFILLIRTEAEKLNYFS